jgi:asparagine synthase (glutamine-hydrolysing)
MIVGSTGPGATMAAAVEEDGTLVAMDGTIFNAEELGGQSLAAFYRRVGFEEMLRRLNGDFAIALVDQRSRSLWLGRDRFGVRPMYYAKTSDGLAFASRPSALFKFPGVSREPHPPYVARFAASHYRYIDNDPEASPYRDIRQLPAASFLHAADGKCTVRRYWTPEDAPDWTSSAEELAERYRELFTDAVVRRFRATARPAFTLSGGLDSSSVLSVARRAAGEKQTAYSVVYDDRTYDESSDIRETIDHDVSDWRTVRVGTPDVFALVRRMVQAHDEPVATATWLSHFILCEEAARAGCTALLGGLGGDELHAGEYEYFPFHFADLRAAGREDDLRAEIDGWIRHHDHPVFRKTPEIAEERMGRLVDRTRLLRYASVLDPSFFRLEEFEPVHDRPFRSHLKNRTWQDLTRETLPCCLRAQDRHCSAFGLDHFEPFLDARLVEFMMRVPGDLKIRQGVTKHLMRIAMRGILPEPTRTRVRKTGWNAPAHVWFSGAGREALHDLVSSRAFRERGIYRVEEVRRLIDEHDEIVRTGAARDNHMMFLWQLVNLELWLREARP